MKFLFDTESVCKYGALPALVLAIHEADGNATAKDIAKLVGRDYVHVTKIIKSLKAAGAWGSCEKHNSTNGESCEKHNFLHESCEKHNSEVVKNTTFAVKSCEKHNSNNESCEKHNFSQEKERKQEKENFPPHPLYKEKEINKEKEANATKIRELINININNAHTREEQQNAVIVSRTNDDKTASELIAIDQHAKRHPLMLEQFCMNNYITPAVFAKLANEVATEWTLKGVTHTNDADARQHFFNTIRLRAADLRRDQPKQRPLKLTWSPNEPLTLPADATDEERAAFLAEVDRRDKEFHKNDNQLPF